MARTANIIVMQRGIPFEMKLPASRPLAINELTKEQFDAELLKGMDDIENDRVFSAEDVESDMRGMYNLWVGKIQYSASSKEDL